MLSPCKGCTARAVGCHAKCGQYQAYDEYRKAVRAKRAAKQKEAEDFFSGINRRRQEWIARPARNRKQ